MSDPNKIMIVDDSRVSRMMIVAIIKDKQPDWEIIEAGSGDEAIELASGKNISYFSLDLNMPGMDGFELIENLKPDFPDSAYALLTANIQEATHKRAQELGAACINKPISENSIGKMLEYFNG